MTDIVITAAKRTAIGGFLGSLSQVPAVDLGKAVIEDVIKDNQLDPQYVAEVILGHVLTGGLGQNPARQAARQAHLPDTTTALTINQVCASGLRAVALAYQNILEDNDRIIIAGGQENMSLSQHAMYLRNGKTMGNATMIDTMINDGLWDAFYNYHMGITAENIAEKWNISREEQDTFAFDSQTKAAKAIANSAFSREITPIEVTIKKETKIFQQDEHPRNVNLESLAKLKPAFKPDGGSVTAGNASGINDGAAVLTLMSLNRAKALNITPRARIVSWATHGVDPKIMGTGPIGASQKALQKAGWGIDDIDLIEANEAFAAQAISVNKEMQWDVSKLNVRGGAIALGHPIGASGARILVTLIHALEDLNLKRGLATLCVGGGMGVALCIERY